MANSPLIIDDGGSTRIKHFRLPPSSAVGAMDGLLDVQPIGGIGQSDHNFPNPLGGFTTAKVIFVDPATGTPSVVVSAPALAAGNRIEVTSGAIKVQVDIGAGGAGTSTIRIAGSAAVDPQVEARQHKGKRRYIVANAPPIDTITVTRGGATTTLYDKTVNDSAYTTLHIS